MRKYYNGFFVSTSNDSHFSEVKQSDQIWWNCDQKIPNLVTRRSSIREIEVARVKISDSQNKKEDFYRLMVLVFIIQRDRSTALYGSTHSVELPYFRSSLIDPEQSAFS